MSDKAIGISLAIAISGLASILFALAWVIATSGIVTEACG